MALTSPPRKNFRRKTQRGVKLLQEYKNKKTKWRLKANQGDIDKSHGDGGTEIEKIEKKKDTFSFKRREKSYLFKLPATSVHKTRNIGCAYPSLEAELRMEVGGQKYYHIIH